MLLRELIDLYRTDRISTYRKCRFFTRRTYDALCRRLIADHGDTDIAEIKVRHVLVWHDSWAADGAHIPLAHALMGMLRTVVNYGAGVHEDAQCERLSGVLRRQKFPMGKPRETHLTAEQAILIRRRAHELGRPSIALAQALQFECTLRQKDVVGEYVPANEPGASDITDDRGRKWLRGLRWEEIDDNLILRHVTSKRLKLIEVDLKRAPMVMEELAHIGLSILPSSGPVVVSEYTELPWSAHEFRRQWRRIANDVGVPPNVWQMDTRAGAITEATEAGASIEHIRHAATHSNVSMTERYSRGAADKIAGVMDLRAAHRKTMEADRG